MFPERLNRLRKRLRISSLRMLLPTLPPDNIQIHQRLPRRTILMLKRRWPLNLASRPSYWSHVFRDGFVE